MIQIRGAGCLESEHAMQDRLIGVRGHQNPQFTQGNRGFTEEILRFTKENLDFTQESQGFIQEVLGFTGKA